MYIPHAMHLSIYPIYHVNTRESTAMVIQLSKQGGHVVSSQQHFLNSEQTSYSKHVLLI